MTPTDHDHEPTPLQITVGRLGQGRGYSLRQELLAHLQTPPRSNEAMAAVTARRLADTARHAQHGTR